MRLFHRTNRAAADLIHTSGFVDATGSYMLEGITLTGVFVSDRPLDANEGAKGKVLLAIDLDAEESALEEFELVEDEKPYREWCLPAALLNTGTIAEVEE